MEKYLSLIYIKFLNIFNNQLALVLGLSLIISGTGCSPKRADSASRSKYINWVNPFLGTAPLTDTTLIGYTPPPGWRVWAGLVYPGTSMPNAMVQLSPITEFGSGAGYEYEDTTIEAFTHTNKGHWNLCHIPVLPIIGNLEYDELKSRFSHESEKAMPGYYQVMLQDFNINVELTSTLRCGYHRYQYPENESPTVVFKLAQSNERVKNWHLDQVDHNVVSGFQDTGSRVHFYAVFNKTISQVDQRLKSGSEYSRLYFSAEDNTPLEMKIGLSFVSVENAKMNLEKEINEQSFEQIKEQAAQTWESHLSKVAVQGGTDREKQLFYSSLYRSFLWPALRSDVNGEFTDAKGEVTRADFNYYVRPSFWDTYRNKLVLLSMFSPEVSNDVIASLIDVGEKTGFIPTFFHGDHAAAYISGSYLRGLKDYDIKKAYDLLLRNANIEGGTRPHITEYIEKGYISTPSVEKPHVESKAKAGVTKTLEYAYDDYAVALLAKSLGDAENYETMMQRSQNYKNLFDANSGFMKGKLEDGSWVKNFNPEYPYYEYMYREANAWQSTFFAPHDTEGLIALYGDNARVEKKLDSLFTIPWNSKYIARNVSGFMGQYCQGNQPDHGFPYLYYYLDKQEKTQEILDKLLSDYYGIDEYGLALSGMDDAGEMSAWYVFNAMGFYPYSPADAEYLVTIPLFDEVTVSMPGAKLFTIEKHNKGKKIETILIDQQEVQDYKLQHDQLVKGGKMVIN
ncbi:GH92 family glycosyl hydrolase [Chondrinema litorale]|uniref:GH92 family glycosyl hydrolase n=1 Tax=Chondrinema litorale TaxID=2994555 RepID=UPI0025427370|nr:GH92 family glycosyl hydrolase [Chondrinema litorale]UZR97549.1 GH92 family glycosyl hydrolase [Chondrinema litorale]